MTDGERLLFALGDPTRHAIVRELRRRAMTVGALSERLPVTRPAVSQHLTILRQARLVAERREGTRHFFSLNPEGLRELRNYADALWDDALASLSRYVAQQKRGRKLTHRKRAKGRRA